jgi:hypothetical protein
VVHLIREPEPGQVMETAKLGEIKKSLSSLSDKELIEVCLRLSKYKKENKELLSYLLYHSGDEQGYVKSVMEEIDKQFNEINRGNSYFMMKGIRKTLRLTNKFIRYSSQKTTEVELLIYFCSKLRSSGIRIHSITALSNLYQRQIFKIRKVISTLHEDLQFDYTEEIQRLGL